MKYYYTYVLLSKKDSKFYFGYSSDLKSRIEQHNSGRVESTKYRRPLELVYFEACLNKDDALKREKYLKTYYGRMFIRKRLKNYLMQLNSYSTGQVGKNFMNKNEGADEGTCNWCRRIYRIAFS